MRIICVIYVLCLPCFRVCLLLPCGHLKGKGLTSWLFDVCCDFVTFPFGIIGQAWYGMACIPDHCCLSNFYYLKVDILGVDILAQ